MRYPKSVAAVAGLLAVFIFAGCAQSPEDAARQEAAASESANTERAKEITADYSSTIGWIDSTIGAINTESKAGNTGVVVALAEQLNTTAAEGLDLPDYPVKGVDKHWDNAMREYRMAASALKAGDYQAARIHKEEGNISVLLLQEILEGEAK